MRNFVAGLVMALVVWAPVWPAHACIHAPKLYAGSLASSSQEAILFFHEGREELLLKVHYQADQEGKIDRFGWVLTVPNEPDAYAVADAELFRETFEWANDLLEPKSRGALGMDAKSHAPAPQGIELGQAVQVGPYDIRPVRARGTEAATQLNAWLAKNGFAELEATATAWFAEKNFTFLCVKVVPAQAGEALAAGGALPPLRVSFKTDAPYYPYKLASTQGVFPLNLYTLTQQPLDYQASDATLKALGWGGAYQDHLRQNAKVAAASFPKHLRAAFGSSELKNVTGPWHLNRLQLKPDAKALALPEGDLVLKLKKA